MLCRFLPRNPVGLTHHYKQQDCQWAHNLSMYFRSWIYWFGFLYKFMLSDKYIYIYILFFHDNIYWTKLLLYARIWYIYRTDLELCLTLQQNDAPAHQLSVTTKKICIPRPGLLRLENGSVVVCLISAWRSPRSAVISWTRRGNLNGEPWWRSLRKANNLGLLSRPARGLDYII